MSFSGSSTIFRHSTVSMLACGLVTLLCLLPALGGGFLIWDDNVNLLSNPPLWQPAAAAARWMFTDIESVQRYKPLCWLIWRLTGEACGLNPIAFHAVNLLFHCGNTLLLFRIIHNFLAGRLQPDTTSSIATNLSASAGTLWWSIHPLRVEPVAWISGAGYALATFFALLALLSFQSYLANGRRRRHWSAVIFFGLSLLCYPAAAALPGLLISLAWLAKPTGSVGGVVQMLRLGRMQLPYLLLASVTLGLTLNATMTTSGEIWNHPAPLASVGIGARTMQAFAIWAWYLGKSLLPWHLSPIYANFWSFSATSTAAIVSLCAILIISVAAWRMRKHYPELPPLWIAFLLLAVPTLGITDVQFSPADRYTYIPDLALALLFASLVSRGLTLNPAKVFGRPLAMGITCAVLVACFVATRIQLRIWRSPVEFFRYAITIVEPNPAAADLHWRLGLHYLTMDKSQLAQEEFAATLRLNPLQADAARYLRVLRKRAETTTGQPSPALSEGGR